MIGCDGRVGGQSEMIIVLACMTHCNCAIVIGRCDQRLARSFFVVLLATRLIGDRA